MLSPESKTERLGSAGGGGGLLFSMTLTILWRENNFNAIAWFLFGKISLR